jgi:hypothetical protein
MTFDSDRLLAVELINEAVLAGAAKFKSCAELGMGVRAY